MLPDNGTEIYHHLVHLREYAASSAKQIMDFAEYMQTVTDTLPDDLKPMGQALTDISIHTLTKSYAVSLQLISEIGIQDITRLALPPEQQTEQVILKRRRSDEI